MVFISSSSSRSSISRVINRWDRQYFNSSFRNNAESKHLDGKMLQHHTSSILINNLSSEWATTLRSSPRRERVQPSFVVISPHPAAPQWGGGGGRRSLGGPWKDLGPVKQHSTGGTHPNILHLSLWSTHVIVTGCSLKAPINQNGLAITGQQTGHPKTVGLYFISYVALNEDSLYHDSIMSPWCSINIYYTREDIGPLQQHQYGSMTCTSGFLSFNTDMAAFLLCRLLYWNSHKLHMSDFMWITFLSLSLFCRI